MSFDISFSPDWLGYSLDGQANRTILGNTTIRMPEDGSHSIQVFGNVSIGTILESDLRFFTVLTNPSEGSPTIPGYNLIALIGVSCLITLLILKKRFN